MRHYCARGTSNGNVLLYKSPFFAWIILNDSTTVYINLATNLPAVSFLFYSLLGTLWNSQRMVNIITLSLCSLNTQNGRARNWTKKNSGRQIFCPCHHIFNPLHQMWCMSRVLSLSELTSKCLFPEAGAHSVTGQAKTDQGVKSETHSIFLQNTFSWFYLFVPIPSQSCAQHCPNTQ